MKAPSFWQNNGWKPRALGLLAALYQWGYRRRRSHVQPATAKAAILCIGNLTIGGSGKTPVALALGEWLKTRFPHACYLTKGYQGSFTGPLQVSHEHTAAEVGDEPLLLATVLPAIMAKDRRKGLAFAELQGFSPLIMDDGFQNPHIAPDISLLVVDSGYGIGNGRTFPAGPLRESVETGIARAHGIILLHRGKQHPLPFATNLPVVEASLATSVDVPATTRAIAFAGLGRPEQFFAALKDKVQLIDTRPFPDHHPYTQAELDRLLALAERNNAQLITTAKDAARLPPYFRHKVIIAKAELVWHNAALLETLLAPLQKEQTL